MTPMMRRLPVLCLLVAVMAGAYAQVAAQAVPPQAVTVERDGAAFHVSAVMHADVPQQVAWEVLTDFSHMVGVVPNLKSSVVEPGRDDRHFMVRQSGVAKFGPFSSDYDSTREIELRPDNGCIRARNVAGNVKSMQSVMMLTPEGNGTRLEYRADVEPGFWLPPLVGPAAVRNQTAEQFSALIREMKRRDGTAAGSGQ